MNSEINEVTEAETLEMKLETKVDEVPELSLTTEVYEGDPDYQTGLMSIAVGKDAPMALTYLERRIGGTEKDVTATLYLGYQDEGIHLHPLTIKYDENAVDHDYLALTDDATEESIKEELDRIKEAKTILYQYEEYLKDLFRDFMAKKAK